MLYSCSAQIQHVAKMLSRFCNNLYASNVHCENGQTMNSEECSEFDTTSGTMVLFNNGYVVILMDTSSMMDNTSQVTIQPSTVKHSIYCYFLSTFEVSTVYKLLSV